MAFSENSHDEDDNYFVTMTDMMVGLLFIFLIMVSFFAYKLSKRVDTADMVPQQLLIKAYSERDALQVKLDAQITENKKLQEELAELKEKIEQLENQLQALRMNTLAQFNESSSNSRRKILRAVQTRVTQLDQSIAITADYERGILRLQGVDLFASGSTTLLNPATVKLLASILEKELECFIFGHNSQQECDKQIGYVEAVYIEGHTDNLPLSSYGRSDGVSNNLQLSARRASNTYQTMVESAPQLSNFQNPANQSIMSVSAYGAQRPLTANTSSEARNRNRRIDIRLEMYQPKDEKEIGTLEELSLLKSNTVRSTPPVVESVKPSASTPRNSPPIVVPGPRTETQSSPSVTWEIMELPSE